MIEEGKFGPQEALWLVTIAISTKVFFTSPATLTGMVGNAGWYLTLISAAVALIGFLFIAKLLKRFPNKDIVEIFDISLGRVFGFVFSIILALYMLFLVVTRISEFSEVIRVYAFPLSPNWYIDGIFVVCIFVVSLIGLESIARLSKLLGYVMLIGFILVLALATQHYNINNLFPIFGYGLDKAIITGVVRSSAYGEVIILAIFATSFQGIKFIKKEGIIGIGLSALYISLSVLAFSLTFPYFIARELTAPMYEMARMIDYGRFLQRVEPIFLFIWITVSLISATIVFYSFVWMFCKMFRIRDKKPIVLGASVIVYAATLLHKDIITVISLNVELTRSFGSIVFILPLLALIVAAIRKKGAKRNA